MHKLAKAGRSGVSIMAERYGSRDSGSVVRLRSTAVHKVARVTEVWLRAIVVRVGRAGVSQCVAAQVGATGFYGFLFDL